MQSCTFFWDHNNVSVRLDLSSGIVKSQGTAHLLLSSAMRGNLSHSRPQADRKEYHLLQLPGGLRVLLVSTLETNYKFIFSDT